MPEGDTVWLACQRLHSALAGKRLTGSELRVPQYAAVDLAEVRVDRVVSPCSCRGSTRAGPWAT